MKGCYYCVEYEVDEHGSGVGLTSIAPHSDYIDNLFWTGALFQDVCLDHEGKYRLHLFLDDEGTAHKGFIEKYVGWQRCYD